MLEHLHLLNAAPGSAVWWSAWSPLFAAAAQVGTIIGRLWR